MDDPNDSRLLGDPGEPARIGDDALADRRADGRQGQRAPKRASPLPAADAPDAPVPGAADRRPRAGGAPPSQTARSPSAPAGSAAPPPKRRSRLSRGLEMLEGGPTSSKPRTGGESPEGGRGVDGADGPSGGDAGGRGAAGGVRQPSGGARPSQGSAGRRAPGSGGGRAAGAPSGGGPARPGAPGGGPARPAPPAGSARKDEKASTWGWILLIAIVVALIFAKWTLLVAILGLAFLITVHEFGHFIFAKKLGMRVERFYVGFPPAAWKHRRGETEYGIGLIPLGGFCKISGMSEEEDLPEEVLPRAYFNQPVWKRNVVIAAGPVMNIVAAVLIIFVFLLARGTVTPTLTIDEVVKREPAAKAGLKPGDTLLGGRVVAAEGEPAQPFTRFRTWDDATAFFQANPDTLVELRYRSGGGGGEGDKAAGEEGAQSGGEGAQSGGATTAPAASVQTVEVRLARSPSDKTQGYLGVGPTGETHRAMPWTAAWLALNNTGDVVVKTFQGFWWLMSGKISATGPDGAVGPVGIVKVSAQAVQQDIYPILLAFISVNLGILNLIPILPFDGGHILFNTIESIRGRKVSTRVMERTAAIGVVLLLTLFVFLTFNDIKRMFGVMAWVWPF